MKSSSFILSKFLPAKKCINKNRPVVRQFNWFARHNESTRLNENRRFSEKS